MNRQVVLCGTILTVVAAIALAQQVPDLEYSPPPLPRPAYEIGKGPRVAIDEAHYNFHTAGGRYKAFAELLRRDGYRVDGFTQPVSTDSLGTVDVLVVANAQSAFSQDEIAALYSWVTKGGALFLIADHKPFPGAVSNLANAFGIQFSNGWALPREQEQREKERGTTMFGKDTGLNDSAVTRGRADDEKITEIATFTGSAFKPPKEAISVLIFGSNFVSFLEKGRQQFDNATPREEIEGWCQGAVMNVGKGRVAVFGEAAMFTAQLLPEKEKMGMNVPEAKQNHQLLLNVMHWLTRTHDMPD